METGPSDSCGAIRSRAEVVKAGRNSALTIHDQSRIIMPLHGVESRGARTVFNHTVVYL